jgi:hypothetical protein
VTQESVPPLVADMLLVIEDIPAAERPAARQRFQSEMERFSKDAETSLTESNHRVQDADRLLQEAEDLNCAYHALMNISRRYKEYLLRLDWVEQSEEGKQ